MPKYTCYYFETESGRSPVKEFIDSLDPVTQRKFFVKCDWLEEYGHRLPMLHTRHLKDGIYELRFEGKEERIIFTNGFKKKTEKTPKREIKLALERRRLYSGNLKA